jgi:4-hydroxybenzoate polyprenyltransferase
VLAGLGLGMGGLQALSGLALGAGPVYYLGVAGSTGHVMWQAYATDLDSPPNCLASFKSNANMGALLMAGIVGDRLLADPGGML